MTPSPSRPSKTRDLVVPCEGQGHNVRLRGGLRFFARARCPRCRARVDPYCVRRLRRFADNLRKPATEAPMDRAVWAASLAGLGLALFTAVVFRATADLWWPSTVLLFGPRWVLLLPLLLLVPLAAWRDRALLVPLATAVVLITGPVMGFTLGLRSLASREKSGDLVVVSYNVAGGSRLTRTVRELLESWNADLLMMQECGGDLRRSLEALEGWYVESAGRSLCAVSRYPLTGERTMDREALASVGGSGLVATWMVEGDGPPFLATNVHLETPRDGLELIRKGRVSEGAEILRQKSILREIELRRASRWSREAGPPGIVLGDFNTPPESRHFADLWSDWTNAFSTAGFGIGGTRLNGWIRARIDHVMVDDSWVVVDAWTGEDAGSDHLPMIARIRRR